MPAPIGGIYASLTADLGGWSRGFNQADQVVARSTASIRRNLGLTDRTLQATQRNMSGRRWNTAGFLTASRSFETLNDRANLLRATMLATTRVAGGLAAAFTTNLVLRYADSYTALQNQLRTVTQSSAQLAASQEELLAIANRSRAGLRETATLYARLQKSLPTRSPAELLRSVETIQKALQLGGATAQEAASAAIQFSQALASNRLQGEEMRALLETPLGLELARGLGVTIGQFREMGTQGQLTADVLLGSLAKISGSIDRQFAASVATTDQALTRLDNALMVSIGQMDKAIGGTRALVGAINLLADNVDDLIPLLAVAGTTIGLAFAGNIAGRGIARMAAGIQKVKAARMEDIRLAREQLEVANERRTSAIGRLGAAGAQDPESLAAGSMVAARKRAAAEVNKLDERAIALRQEYMRVVSAAGRLELQETARARQLRVAQINAVERLNQSLARQAEIRQRLAQARTSATARAGTTAVTGIDTGKLADDVKTIGRLHKDLNAEVARSARVREDIGRREVSVQQQLSTAQYRLFQQRLTLAEQAGSLERQIKSTDRDLAGAKNRAQAAAALVMTAGQKELAAQTAEATAALARANAQVQLQTRLFSSATRAATGFAVGMSLLRNATSGFIAALGGGWGVAITAALAGLTIWGARAASAAQESQEFADIIREQLGHALTEAGGKADEAAESLNRLTLTQLEGQLETIRNGMSGIREEIESTLLSSIEDLAAGWGALSDRSLPDFAKQIDDLGSQFERGSITANEYSSAIARLSRDAEMPDELKRELDDLLHQFRNGGVAVDRLSSKIALIPREVDVVVTIRAAEDASMAKLRGFIPNARVGSAFGQAEAGDLIAGPAAEESGLQEMMEEAAKVRGAAGESFMTFGEALDVSKARLAEEARITAEKEAQNEAQKAGNDAAEEAKRLAEQIAQIQQDARISGFSELDRQVISSMQGLEAAKGMVDEYINAVEEGNLEKAPQQMLEVRDALERSAAMSELPALIEKYGTAAQHAELFAEKQKMLNILVAEGSITSAQATQAYNAYVNEFRDLQWAEDVASAFSTMAESAIDDFDNIEEAFADLVRQMGKIALQTLALKPFEKSLTGFLGGIGTAGAGSAGLSEFALGVAGGGGGVYHGGGEVGKTKVPMRYGVDFRGAPRYASGLLPNEMRAVLHKSEAILNDSMQRRVNGALSGLSSVARGSGPGRLSIEVLPSELFTIRVRDQTMREIAVYDGTRAGHTAARAAREADRRSV